MLDFLIFMIVGGAQIVLVLFGASAACAFSPASLRLSPGRRAVMRVFLLCILIILLWEHFTLFLCLWCLSLGALTRCDVCVCVFVCVCVCVFVCFSLSLSLSLSVYVCVTKSVYF